MKIVVHKTVLERFEDFYSGIIPYEYRPKQIWYKLKGRFWSKFNTIKCRYLPYTWNDRSEVLPHVMFEVLSRFIEQECSPGHIDWEGSGHTVTVNGKEKNVRQEMQDLYDWWHQSYIKEYEEIAHILYDEAEKHHGEFVFEPDKNGFSFMNIKYESEEHEEINYVCMKAAMKLDKMRDKKLNEMMHRLVNLTTFLWT